MHISLKGGQIHYTESSDTVYRVLEGTVLVFMMPVTDGRYGRRLLLGEFEAGSAIPGFHHRSELLGEWVLGLAALDKAVLSSAVTAEQDAEHSEELRRRFGEQIGLSFIEGAGFHEALIEKYELVTVRDNGRLFLARREKERTKERTFRMMYDHLKSDKSRLGEKVFSETGNALYDAAAFICAYEDMDIIAFDRLVETSGRKFTVHDIARLSHFVIREVVLEPGWHKRDSGPLLVFTEDGGDPLACIPKNAHSYYLYDSSGSRTEVLDDSAAKGIRSKAFMFYRPFFEKSLTRRDLLRFGAHNVYRSDIIRLLLLTLLGTLVGLLLPYLNQQAFDKFIPMGNAPGLVQIGAVILACSLGNISFTIVKNLASFRFMNAMKYAVQSAVFDRLFNLPESFYREYDAANLGQRAMGITTIYTVLAQSAVSAALSAVFSLLYLWRMYRYSSAMSNAALVLLAAVSAVIILCGLLQTGYERRKQEADNQLSSISFQLLSGVSKIRNAYAEDRALQRYIEASLQSKMLQHTKEKLTVLVQAITGVAPLVFTIIFYYQMIRKDLGLSIGQFTGFSAAFGAFSGAVLTIVSNYLTVNNVKPLYEFARPILDTLPETGIDADLPGDLRGEIDVTNVTFSYSPDEPPALNNINLHIDAGEYVGIVGSSGCGKSTLLKLLLGFEKPQTGRVYYDNRDIDDLDKRELRKKMGVVLQNGGLITGSIYENITIAAPDTEMSRVEQVIRDVGLEEDIKRMPMGLHTVIAEGAGTISGGQAQRLMIARAIINRPGIIFLDEATSALDNVTQNQIVSTLESLDATKIVIAHRLSTVQNCDRIIVMDKGSIVEQGTYQELMDKKGLFYDLAVRQIA